MSDVVSIKSSIDQMEEDLAKLRIEIAYLRDKFHAIDQKREVAINQYDQLKIEEMQQTNIIDWDWLLRAASDDGFVTQSTNKRRILASVLNDHGLQTGYCYDRASCQFVVTVALNKNDNGASVKRALSGLNTIIPHFYSWNTNGVVLVNILEHTLSEFGQYYLNIYADKVDLMQLSYGKERTVETFKNLEEALLYVQQFYYYQTDDDED